MRQQPLEKEHRNYLRFYNQQLRTLVKESREATVNFHDQVIVNPNIEYVTQKLHNTVIGSDGCVYTVMKAHGASVHGRNSKNDIKESPIGVLWTRSEKEKFFTALARYSIHNLASIKAHLPNKSEVEILNYYHLLKSSLKNYQKKKKTSKKLLKYDNFPIAYEMSEYFTDLENGQADLATRDENREILRDKAEENAVNGDFRSSTESSTRTQEDDQFNTTNTIKSASDTVPGTPSEEDDLFIKENITELTKFLTQNNNLEALKDKTREQLDFKDFFYSPTAVIKIVPPSLSSPAEDVLKQLVRAYITKLLHKIVQSKLANYHLGERMDNEQDVNVEIDNEDVRRALYYENTRTEIGRNVRNIGNINPLYNKVYLSNMQKNLNIKLEPEHHRRPATFQAKIFDYLDFMISARWLHHLESVNILAYNNFDYFEKLFPQRKFGLLFVKFLKKNDFNIVDCGKVGLPICAKEYREAVFAKTPKCKLLKKKSDKGILEGCNKVDNDDDNEENTDMSSNFSNGDTIEQDVDEEDSDEELDIGPAVHVSKLKKTNSKQYRRQPGTDYYKKLAYKYPTSIDIDSQMLGNDLSDSDFSGDESVDEGPYDEKATEKNTLPFIVDDDQSTQELDNVNAIKAHFREAGKLDQQDKEVSAKYQKMILRYLNLYNTDPNFTFFVSEPPRSVKGDNELKRVRRQARGSESIVRSYLVRRKQYETYITSYKRLLKWSVDSKRKAFHLANFKAFVVSNPVICQKVMAKEDNWRVLKTEENIWKRLKQLFISKMSKHINFQFKYDEEMDYDLSNSAVAGGSLREAIVVARKFGLRVPQPLVEIMNREQKQKQEKLEQQQQHQIGKEPLETQPENHVDDNDVAHSYKCGDAHNSDFQKHLVEQGFGGITPISSHRSCNISEDEVREDDFDFGNYGRDQSKDQSKSKISQLEFNFKNINFKDFEPDEVNLDEYTFGPGDDLYSSSDEESSLDKIIENIDGEPKDKFEHAELKRKFGDDGVDDDGIDDDDDDLESDDDADVMPAAKKLKTADGGLQNAKLKQSHDFPIW